MALIKIENPLVPSGFNVFTNQRAKTFTNELLFELVIYHFHGELDLTVFTDNRYGRCSKRRTKHITQV